MIIETQRDTEQIFRQIKVLATENYKRFYDGNFKTMHDVKDIPQVLKNAFSAASMNNRSVMNAPKLE
jgi:hypothetical protein